MVTSFAVHLGRNGPGAIWTPLYGRNDHPQCMATLAACEIGNANTLLEKRIILRLNV
jgi:hypothetical protein